MASSIYILCVEIFTLFVREKRKACTGRTAGRFNSNRHDIRFGNYGKQVPEAAGTTLKGLESVQEKSY